MPRTRTFRGIEIVDGDTVLPIDSARDTEPLGPVTVPKTACVLTPSTLFVCPTDQRGLTPSWAGPQLHASAPKRSSDGRMGDAVPSTEPRK
jgi:hypothetical protein